MPPESTPTPPSARVEADPDALATLRADPAMARLVARFGPYGWELRPPFPALVRAVAGQSVSGASAAAVARRLDDLTGITPEGILAHDVEALRGAGVTRSKARALREIAEAARRGDLDDLPDLSDAEVAARLEPIHGVGRWTVHMLLIFGLGRLDVWPVGDLGVVQRGAARWGAEGRAELRELGERFRPWRSAAVWYLWRDQEAPEPDD